MLEAVPAGPFRVLSVALQIRHAIVGRDIMLAGDVEHAIGMNPLDDLVRRVELLCLRELRDVARMQDERWTLGKGIELRDGQAEGRGDVLVRFLIEADVTVRDLS